jgi:hypothetical protein
MRCMILALLLMILPGCIKDRYVVVGGTTEPTWYAYGTDWVEVPVLLPDGKGGYIRAVGNMPPGTVYMAPSRPTTRPAK